MANLLDYLDWRGDLTLRQSPFNEVDNLILAELSFVDFGGIVPPPGQGEGVPLSRAAMYQSTGAVKGRRCIGRYHSRCCFTRLWHYGGRSAGT